MLRTSVENANQSSIATLVASAAFELFEAMDYSGAHGALEAAGYWPPTTDCDIPEILEAQGVVLCFGFNAHEQAKDILSKSVRLFADSPRAGRARVFLALSYWAGGEVQEARATLSAAQTTEYRYCLLVASGMIESDPDKALKFYSQAEPLAANQPVRQQAKFHNLRGMALRALAGNKSRNTRAKDLKAINALRERSELEYITGLSLAAEYPEIEVSVMNNLAGLYTASGKYEDAHSIVDQVIVRLADAKHQSFLGKAIDQRAALFLAQGKLKDAIQAARRAVTILEPTNRQSWLAEALLRLGTALARDREYTEARSQMERAVSLCEHVGDRSQAGEVRAAMIQELPLDCQDAFLMYSSVDEAAQVKAIQALLYRIEAELIRLALEKTGGSKAQAAKIMGISRQALEKKLESSFPQFLTKPKRARRKRVLFSPLNQSC